MKRVVCLAVVLLFAIVSCKKEPNKVAVTGITLNPTSVKLVIGKSEKLSATVTPADASDKKVVWSTDNTAVATVSDGVVTAVAPGSATITAKSSDGGFTATCAVTVDKILVESVSLSPTSLALTLGEKVVVTATISPSDATDKTISWVVIPNNVVTLSDSGDNLSREFEAVGAGNAVITAYATGGSGVVKAECNVTVTAVPSGAVDLGITMKGSGGTTYTVYWADRNLGATSVEGNGDYYAWGEVATKTDYSWAKYKWSDGAYNKLTKYCPTGKQLYWAGSGSPDGKLVLDIGDDVANKKLGGNWRMPTLKELQALAKCNCAWTTQNGVKGMRVTGSNGNSIFLPAAGFKKNTDSAGAVGTVGYYWSSTLRDDSPEKAWYGLIKESGFSLGSPERCNGYPVRAVYQPAQ